ncbi:MAG: hypothetical protein HYS81_04185 [Candidatus Aenigmatarchaeota archaeon]|nr:MAG: hypothetical protein HYS81_04185 [Candidatus Aenigmarchaeota archaeon]
MDIVDMKKLIQEIVAQACLLSAKHTSERDAPVNYACIFTQSQSEYEDMLNLARQMGPVVDDTSTGPVFQIVPLSTDAGDLGLLKIRRPDTKRPERGDADFTVSNYQAFKKTCLGKPGFALIKRRNMEMLELVDSSFDVIAYYSHPTLAEVLGIKSSVSRS